MVRQVLGPLPGECRGLGMHEALVPAGRLVGGGEGGSYLRMAHRCVAHPWVEPLRRWRLRRWWPRHAATTTATSAAVAATAHRSRGRARGWRQVLRGEAQQAVRSDVRRAHDEAATKRAGGRMEASSYSSSGRGRQARCGRAAARAEAQVRPRRRRPRAATALARRSRPPRPPWQHARPLRHAARPPHTRWVWSAGPQPPRCSPQAHSAPPAVAAAAAAPPPPRASSFPPARPAPPADAPRAPPPQPDAPRTAALPGPRAAPRDVRGAPASASPRSPASPPPSRAAAPWQSPPSPHGPPSTGQHSDSRVAAAAVATAAAATTVGATMARQLASQSFGATRKGNLEGSLPTRVAAAPPGPETRPKVSPSAAMPWRRRQSSPARRASPQPRHRARSAQAAGQRRGRRAEQCRPCLGDRR
eukprot:scaffold20333_cov64-Phaeocystis_antarctica.AAC.8